jgi:hypothetical protein
MTGASGIDALDQAREEAAVLEIGGSEPRAFAKMSDSSLPVVPSSRF